MKSCKPCILEVGQRQMLLGVRWLADASLAAKHSSCSAVLRDSLFYACHVAHTLSVVFATGHHGVGLGREFVWPNTAR